jgi:outer membrane protein OmpA-like peptidoglycan-associated protein
MRTRLPLLIPTTLGAFLLASAHAALAHAQAKGKDGEFSIQRFEPAIGSHNYLSVEGARMDSAWGFTAGLMFNYSRDPFMVLSCKSQSDCSTPNKTNQESVGVVRDMFTWDLMGSIMPMRWLQIGARVPLSFVSGEGIDTTTGQPPTGGLRGFGIGDPTIEGKARFLGGVKDPVVLGAAADVSFPVGHAMAEGKYIGNASPVTVGLRGIFDGEMGPVSFGLNVKGIWRQDATLGSTTLGPEFRYGGALGYRVSPVFRVVAEGYGSTRFSSKNGTNTLEVDGGLQIQPMASRFMFTVGGGAGVLEGVGVPAARAIAGITFINEVGDKDGDGLNDNDDKCPTIAEDQDGFQDEDGCPDPDNDGDGIPDGKDKCPNKPETINGYQDEDGCPDQISDRDKDGVPDAEDKCPDEGGKVIKVRGAFYGCADRDGDGVADKVDQCPEAPEDTDGFQDEDGCPDPDNDHDGIPDDRDECLMEPEVMNGFQDEDGCPDEAPDRDKDGIPDSADKCPDKPENFNGYQDDDGCPDAGPSLVQVTGDEIKILQKVEFATSSDKIQGATSFKVLDAVEGVLKSHTDIFLVEVAGHTDNVGGGPVNTALSQKRADAVVKYLVGKGIASHRLVGKGYGPDKPVADNKTAAGRGKNRRVEFNILKSAKNPGTPAPAPAAPAP